MNDSNDAIFVITPRKLERIAYLFIIAVLVILLVFFAFFKDAKCETTTNTTSATGTGTTAGAGGSTPATPAVNTSVQETPAAPVASCTDGKKNQDETDVDCGGATCLLCKQGKKCAANTDCATGRCTGGFCVAALSGDVTLTIKDAGFSGGGDTAVRVTDADLTIVNGQGEDLDASVNVYFKTSSGTFYLNQQDDEEKGDPQKVIELGVIKSGATLSKTVEIGKYLFSGEDAHTGDFIVELDLVDSSSGEILATASKKIEI